MAENHWERAFEFLYGLPQSARVVAVITVVESALFYLWNTPERDEYQPETLPALEACVQGLYASLRGQTVAQEDDGGGLALLDVEINGGHAREAAAGEIAGAYICLTEDARLPDDSMAAWRRLLRTLPCATRAEAVETDESGSASMRTAMLVLKAADVTLPHSFTILVGVTAAWGMARAEHAEAHDDSISDAEYVAAMESGAQQFLSWWEERTRERLALSSAWMAETEWVGGEPHIELHIPLIL